MKALRRLIVVIQALALAWLLGIRKTQVDLVPNAQTQQQRASATSELSRVKSTDSSQSVDDGFQSQPLSRTTEEQKTIPDAGAGTFKGLVKERRHQIPGLRETPYLKVYV